MEQKVGTMNYIIKLSFGPVQEFIAAARKLEDLWSGSRMLGDLIKAVLKTVQEEELGEIIYPVRDSSADVANLPNTVLLKLNGDRGPESVAGRVQDVFQGGFREMVTNVKQLAGCIWVEEVTERQIDAFPEFSWAAAPYSGNGAFKTAIDLADRLFFAGKNTRRFPPGRETGIKCTLHPNLAALCPQGLAKTDDGDDPGLNPDKLAREFWKTLKCRPDVNQKIIHALRSDGSERFSTIGLAKRMYRRDPKYTAAHFPSTCSIAGALWRRRFLDELDKDGIFQKAAGDQLTQAHQMLTQIKRKDEQRFYELWADPEAVPDLLESAGGGAVKEQFLSIEPSSFIETEPQQGDIDKKNEVAPFLKCIQNLLQLAQEKGAGSPPRHYALIFADGDGMGDIVKSCADEETLHRLSTNLNAFAEKAIQLIEGKDITGRVIYSGGDDIMAVTPVSTALAAACRLRRKYRKMMTPFQGLTKDGGGNLVQFPATLSAAVVIAPGKYPLYRVLGRARRGLEQEAKHGEKDALAVSVIKGDDEVVSFVSPADRIYEDTAFQFFSRFEVKAKVLAGLFSDQAVSSRSVYDLRRTLYQIGETITADSGLIRSVFAARLATNRQLAPEQIEEAKAMVDDFLTDMSIISGKGSNRFDRPDILAEMLIAFRHIGRLACEWN